MKRTWGVTLLTLLIVGQVYAQEIEDPNLVRNDDLRMTNQNSQERKQERDLKLDKMVDRLEELRIKEEALAEKKKKLIGGKDQSERKSLESEFKQLEKEKREAEVELIKIKSM